MSIAPLDPYVFDAESLFAIDDYLYFMEETLRAEDTDGQVDQIERQLGLTQPSRVLDMGCGHGRHSIALASRGHRVHGVDMMEGFINYARRTAADMGVAATFERADLRRYVATESFDAAICIFDAFGLHHDDENLAVLTAMSRSLAPGGGFCLDMRNRDWIARHMQMLTMLERGEDLMIDRHAIDSVTGRLIDRRIMVRGGRVRYAPFSVRLYGMQEIIQLLASVGLAASAAWGDWTGLPVSINRNRMVLFGSKV